jgi:hypothetical protein
VHNPRAASLAACLRRKYAVIFDVILKGRLT